MPRMSHSSSRELSRSLQTKTHCLSFIVPLPKSSFVAYGNAMRTVWTMGFVAAAALSFCFPDFIVFQFAQAAIWAIALLGLVLSFISSRTGKASFYSDPSVSHGDTVEAELAGVEAGAGAADEGA